MNELISKRGELRSRALQHNIMSVVSFGDDTESPTHEIEILTLKQHLKEQAQDTAWGIETDINKIDTRVDTLLKTSYTHCCEFVEIADDKIKVGVDSDLIDDAAITHAVFLLTDVDDFSYPHTINLSEEIQVYGFQTEKNRRTG